MTDPVAVEIIEVGPRDGLQNEGGIIPTDAKVALVDALVAAGVREVEVGSFVRPDLIPQLADTRAVLDRIKRVPGVIHSVLVPNERGLHAALEAGVEKIAVFTSASEGFARANVNASIAETIDRFRPVVEQSHVAGLPVRGYVSCVIRCPHDGLVTPEQVRTVCQRLLDIGVDEIDLGDTIGIARPDDIEAMLSGLDGLLRPDELVLHLHDTSGTAIECARRGIRLGVRRFDSSCGGLGGCPFAPGSAGNLATEDLLALCREEGLETGIDADAVAEASRVIRALIDSVGS